MTFTQSPERARRPFFVGGVLLVIGMAIEALSVLVLVASIIWPYARSIDQLGAPPAIAAWGLLLFVSLYVVARRTAPARTDLAHPVVVIRYLRRVGGWPSWLQVFLLVGGIALVVWIFASGQGNYLVSTSHGEYFGIQPGHNERQISFEEFHQLSRISNVWTPVGISLVLCSGNSITLLTRSWFVQGQFTSEAATAP